MSFATLSSTLEECSAISKLELTKNPFDIDLEERLNLPSLSSPTIFTKQETPASQKKGFRWSIDQISKLNPADIDEFPNQEYSSTYERPEDETRAQEAINEYFSRGTILPSPWTPDNHVKHVTFSPLPPSTAYISGEEESLTDASHNSSCNTSGRRQVVHAACQTSLTFPPSFDLSKIVDSGYYSYVEDEASATGKDLNVSSLRRKLFIQEDSNSSPEKLATDKKPSCKQQTTRSILKSPSPMNLLTSSPFKDKDRLSLHPDVDSPFSSTSRTSHSPGVSPIKATAARLALNGSQECSGLQLDGTLSHDDVFTSNILESSDVCINPSLFPDVSPIKDIDVHQQAADHDDECATDGDNPKEIEQLNDGGPMKISELSNVTMDVENNNHSEMNVSELQPLNSPKSVSNHDGLTSSESGKGSPSRNVLRRTVDDRIDEVTFGKIDESIGIKEQKEISGIPVTDGQSDLTCTSNDVIYGKGNDLIRRRGDDVSSKNSNSYVEAGFEKKEHSTKETRRLSNVLQDWKKDMADSQGYLGEMRGLRDNGECHKENVDSSGGRVQDYGDDELLNRASAAIRRADRLVHETFLEQGMVPRRTGPSTGLLNWSRFDGTSSWHPIDMSTPVVNGKLKEKPLDLQAADTLMRARGQLSDVDSYNHLLSSFANSRLDQGQRSFRPAGNHDSGVETLSSDYHSRDRARTMGLESRGRRSLSDIGNSVSTNPPRDAYLLSRYGYTRTPGKRFSWPLWKPVRSRYHHLRGKTVSPTIPCLTSRRRRRSADDKPMSRRSEEFGRLERPSDHRNQKYEDYFNGMHSNLRRMYCR